MNKRHVRSLWLSLVMTGLVVGATPVFADNTLDAMNSLAPAPATQQVTGNRTIMIPAAPQVTATAYILMDADSGVVIASNNPDQRLPPASLTKLMTLYVIFGALKNGQIHMTDQVPISEKAWRTGGSKMFIRVGNTVPLNDLLQGVIVASGNDSAIALAEYVAGSEDAFVSLMNQEAKQMGLKNSHFSDCNGLPSPDHYSSAKDLAILAQHIVQDYPQYYPMFSEKSFSYNNITQPNRNRLLNVYPYADGLKTGHTADAGYCLVASAKQNGMRLITVVMGEPTEPARVNDSMALMTYGYRFYKTYQLYGANQAVTQARVWQGQDANVAIGLAKPLYVTVPIGQYSKLAADANLNQPIFAPIAQGQTLGQISVTLDGKPLLAQPLVALTADPQGNLWRRLADRVSLSIHNMLKKKEVAAAAAKANAMVNGSAAKG